jgi:hypothetical protein
MCSAIFHICFNLDLPHLQHVIVQLRCQAYLLFSEQNATFDTVQPVDIKLDTEYYGGEIA